jgi:hypothetical protein
MNAPTPILMDVDQPAALPFPQSLPEFQRLFPDDAACAEYLDSSLSLIRPHKLPPRGMSLRTAAPGPGHPGTGFRNGVTVPDACGFKQ